MKELKAVQEQIRGYSIDDLAKYLGVTPSAIYKRTSGKNKPNRQNIRGIIERLESKNDDWLTVCQKLGKLVK